MVQLPRFVTAETPFSKLLAMLVVIALPIFGFFLGIRYQETLGLAKQFEEQRNLLITPTPTLSPAEAQALEGADETANWKTYVNTKYGYSIKHPQEWQEQIKCEGGIPNDDYICFKSPDFEESPIPNTTSGGLITIEGNREGSYFTAGSIDNFCKSRPDLHILECKQIKTGNLTAMQRMHDYVEDVGIIQNGKFIISIRVSYTKDSKFQILKQFDQILSTFQFSN